MMIFPLEGLFDEQACYDYLLRMLHPEGLRCPAGHALPEGQAPHERSRAPILDYRCRTCGAVYNLFTGTVFSKTHLRPSEIVQILRGIAQGTPTKHLAEELGLDRKNLGAKRRRIQAALAERLFPPGPAGR